jgi:EAL domain-containing protein (putative c-di-GMP-specific phosphodiesterase class I)
VRGIVNLGESLNMSVVAEGIEEPGQADQIRRMHSPLGQGYLFSRPVAANQLQTLLNSGKPLVKQSPAESGSDPEPDAEHAAS